MQYSCIRTNIVRFIRTYIFDVVILPRSENRKHLTRNTSWPLTTSSGALGVNIPLLAKRIEGMTALFYCRHEFVIFNYKRMLFLRGTRVDFGNTNHHFHDFVMKIGLSSIDNERKGITQHMCFYLNKNTNLQSRMRSSRRIVFVWSLRMDILLIHPNISCSAE